MNKKDFISGLTIKLADLRWTLTLMKSSDIFNTKKIIEIENICYKLEDVIKELEDSDAVNLSESEE